MRGQLLVALSHLLNALCGGHGDEGLCVRAHRLRHLRRWARVEAVLDALLRPFERDHCRKAYAADLGRRCTPPAMRTPRIGD